MRQLILMVFTLFVVAQSARAAALRVVCAEAVWCQIAQDIGGPLITTRSILTSPQLDPHDYQATPQTARALAQADIVIFTGGHYDDWIRPLLSVSSSQKRLSLSVAELSHLAPGANPHLFDDVKAVRLLVDRLAAVLGALPPEKCPSDGGCRQGDAHRHCVEAVAQYHRLFDTITARLSRLRPETTGKKIAVAELTGGPLFEALGVRIVDPDFALSTMGGRDPLPRQIAQLYEQLRRQEVSLFVSNAAFKTPLLAHLETVARAARLPILRFDEFPVGTDSEPNAFLWGRWVNQRIDQLREGLAVHEEYAERPLVE